MQWILRLFVAVTDVEEGWRFNLSCRSIAKRKDIVSGRQLVISTCNAVNIAFVCCCYWRREWRRALKPWRRYYRTRLSHLTIRRFLPKRLHSLKPSCHSHVNISRCVFLTLLYIMTYLTYCPGDSDVVSARWQLIMAYSAPLSCPVGSELWSLIYS